MFTNPAVSWWQKLSCLHTSNSNEPHCFFIKHVYHKCVRRYVRITVAKCLIAYWTRLRSLNNVNAAMNFQVTCVDERFVTDIIQGYGFCPCMCEYVISNCHYREMTCYILDTGKVAHQCEYGNELASHLRGRKICHRHYKDMAFRPCAFYNALLGNTSVWMSFYTQHTCNAFWVLPFFGCYWNCSFFILMSQWIIIYIIYILKYD